MLVLPVDVDLRYETEYQNKLTRLNFRKGQVNSVTAFSSEYALLSTKKLLKQIVDDESISFDDLEVMPNPVTSDERQILRSRFLIPESI